MHAFIALAVWFIVGTVCAVMFGRAAASLYREEQRDDQENDHDDL